jgi:hypothetical protein
MHIFYCFLFVALLSGCATQPFAWTVNTNPQGATVSNANGQSGVSPVTFNYALTPRQISGQDNIYLGEVTATWVSGVTTKQTVSTTIAPGWHQQTTIQRPNAPNLDLDVQFAMNQQNVAQQRLQNTIYLQQVLQQGAPKTTTCGVVFGKYQCTTQ